MDEMAVIGTVLEILGIIIAIATTLTGVIMALILFIIKNIRSDINNIRLSSIKKDDRLHDELTKLNNKVDKVLAKDEPDIREPNTLERLAGVNG